MLSFRDHKRMMRRRLHQVFKVAALYLPTPNAEPVPLYVRVHTKWETLGASGGERDAPQRQEVTPKILFMLDELAAHGATLLKGGIISVERGEAYALDNAEAPDLISVKWIVTQVQNQSRLAEYPIPSSLPENVWIDVAAWDDASYWVD